MVIRLAEIFVKLENSNRSGGNGILNELMNTWTISKNVMYDNRKPVSIFRFWTQSYEKYV